MNQNNNIDNIYKLMTEYTLNDSIQEYLDNNTDSEFLLKYGVYGVLSLEYYSNNNNFDRCCFRALDNDFNYISCYRYGIPSQIIYQSSYIHDSPFKKYTVKKLKNICKHIYGKLDESLDKVILETYINYEHVPIKFSVDYLKADYFRNCMKGPNVIKANYINYLTFMSATGAFEYELSHIDDISDAFEENLITQAHDLRKKGENEIVVESVYKYLLDTRHINIKDYLCSYKDEAYWDGFGYSSNYYEEYDGDNDYYRELVLEHPNKHYIYKWDGALDRNVIISNFTITPIMALLEYFEISSLCTMDLTTSIEKIERLLNLPVKYVMTLEEFIKNGFKL